MGRRSRYSPEVRERAVRMVFEHEREYSSQWGAMTSIAAKIGCTAETLRQVGPTGGKGSGASSRADNGREAASEGTGAGESGAEAD